MRRCPSAEPTTRWFPRKTIQNQKRKGSFWYREFFRERSNCEKLAKRFFLTLTPCSDARNFQRMFFKNIITFEGDVTLMENKVNFTKSSTR
jgi:hypothetical protein